MEEKILPVTREMLKRQKLEEKIPEFVIECFNNLISKKYSLGESYVWYYEIIKEIINHDDFQRFQRFHNITMNQEQYILDKKWLDVEELYMFYGWNVIKDLGFKNNKPYLKFY